MSQEETVLTKFIADAESHLAAQKSMREAEAALSKEERAAQNERNKIAAERQAAFADIFTLMKEEQARGEAIQKMIEDVSKVEQKAATARATMHADWIRSLADIGLAYTTLQRIGGEALELMEFAAKRSRQEHAALGVDVDKLRVASMGLASQTQLLGDAARFNNGEVKLTAEQMQIAEKAIVGYTRRGYEMADAHEAVMHAVVDLKTKGMDELATHIDKSGLSMDSASDRSRMLSRVYDELRKVAGDVKDGHDEMGEGIERASVKLKDSWDKVKSSLGELAASLQPLITALAQLLGLLAEFIKQTQAAAKDSPMETIGAFISGGTGQIAGHLLDDANKRGMLTAKNVGYGLAATGGANVNAGGILGAFTPDGDVNGWLGAASNMFFNGGLPGGFGGASNDNGTPNPQRQRDHGGSAADNLQALAAEREQWMAVLEMDFGAPLKRAIDQLGDTAKEVVHGDYGRSEEDKAEAEQAFAVLRASYLDPVERALKEIGGTISTMAHMEGGPTVLERMFGKHEEVSGYREMWLGLQNAVTASYDAMIKGTMSAGQAAKHALADFLEAEGKKMLVLGMEETATAIATLDPHHLLAAAEYFAGAAVAGVAAHELGAGGGASGGGSTTAPSSSGNGTTHTTTAGPQINATIVYGDSFADDSPYMRQLKADNLVNRALGGVGARAA